MVQIFFYRLIASYVLGALLSFGCALTVNATLCQALGGTLMLGTILFAFNLKRLKREIQNMTFSQYIQNLGFLLAQWLPICGLQYLAVRWGVQHGIAAYHHRYAVYTKGAPPASELSDEQRTRISKP